MKEPRKHKIGDEVEFKTSVRDRWVIKRGVIVNRFGVLFVILVGQQRFCKMFHHKLGLMNETS